MTSIKFELGRVVGTHGALEALEAANQQPGEFLGRHMRGDWGDDLDDEDRLLNDASLIDGTRLLSAYTTAKGVKLWVITEGADDAGRRASTTMLLPEEY